MWRDWWAEKGADGTRMKDGSGHWDNVGHYFNNLRSRYPNSNPVAFDLP
jgi:hypothetical protein